MGGRLPHELSDGHGRHHVPQGREHATDAAVSASISSTRPAALAATSVTTSLATAFAATPTDSTATASSAFNTWRWHWCAHLPMLCFQPYLSL